ncbi:class I adenylate-forming enzyme family protein [Rhodopseudomonas palustris]|uniref:3-methylmercaptopropionyl-CoA ligase n=1 Tax=Rhodopseudomonas palustris TaxID=1076 RepID=A0A418V1H8_RHOPL|nr:class I adenylate-forming enzyme family protein [Rhodopseudomonas palustris]RJF69752.1 long-chain fatty acid--CoA ligase [Rhodopseudomonas palustris]
MVGSADAGGRIPAEAETATVFDLVRRQASQRPDAIALTAASRFGGEHSLSYSALLDRATMLAAGLCRLQLSQGDRVGLMFDNESALEAAITMLALHRLGLVVVPVNTRFAAEEIVYVLGKADCGAIVAAQEFVALVSALRERIPSLQSIVGVGDKLPADVIDWREMAETDGTIFTAWPEVSPDAISEILFTSGTTAHPKGAVMTHSRSVISAYGFADALSLDADDVYQSFFPFFTTAALHCVLLPSWWAGAEAVLDRRFDLPEILARMHRRRATKYIGAPTFYVFLLETYDPAAHDLSSIRMFDYGGASMSVEVIRKLAATFPSVELRQTYGMTESGPSGTVMRGPDNLIKPGAVGRPWALTEVRIAGGEGCIVGPGERGEIEIRSPAVMREYFGEPQLTAATFHDGWLRTGDIGYLDQDGYLFHVDRKKDMIIRGGHNIGSLEVEEVFFAHPAVVEAAVISVPHPKLGEDICAFVVPQTGHTITADELRAFCIGKLADYKIPRWIEFADTLPRGPMGKVLKTQLRDRVQQRLAEGDRNAV